MIVFLKGKFTDEDKARIDPGDRGLTLADGVFDTMLAVDGRPVMAAAHFTRLKAHAAVLNIPVSGTAQSFGKIAADLLVRNGFVRGRHAVRTTVTRGPAPGGLAPPEKPESTILMQVRAAPPPLSGPVSVIIAAGTRRNEHSPLSRIKSLQYADNLLALVEARGRGADDAILLNGAGHAACATTANIFVLEGDTLLTPPLSSGALDGTVRAQVMRCPCKVRETQITARRLQGADGIYLTSSLVGIRVVGALDGADMTGRDGGFYERILGSLPALAA